MFYSSFISVLVNRASVLILFKHTLYFSHDDLKTFIFPRFYLYEFTLVFILKEIWMQILIPEKCLYKYSFSLDTETFWKHLIFVFLCLCYPLSLFISIPLKIKTTLYPKNSLDLITKKIFQGWGSGNCFDSCSIINHREFVTYMQFYYF